MRTETFDLGNLCCVSCANDIERALRANRHVQRAAVNYRRDTATVTYHDDMLAPDAVAEIILSAGHGCTQVSPVGPPLAHGAGHEAAEAAPVAAHVADHAGGSHMAHLHHQTQMAPISMGTKMDRMQYEMPATQAAHVHEQMQHGSAEPTAMDHAAMGHAVPVGEEHVEHEGHMEMGMAHDMSDPKMARAMEADMRTRFWVALVLTIPTLLYSPLFTQFFGVRLPARR